MAVDFKLVVDNSDAFKKGMEDIEEVILETIGLAAEGYAKRLCPVGTPESTGVPGYIGGTLRNSITHAVSGNPTSIDSYKDNSGNIRGEYTGTAPKEEDGKKAVYVGTNVYYGPYVEMGTTHTRAQPFLKPAIENHVDEYKKYAEDAMKG